MKYLVQKNLVYTIHSAVGSKMFQHAFVRRADGSELDAQDSGRLSCAYIVSGILTLHMLMKQPHAEVASTIKDMEDSGWLKTDRPVPGCVIHWPANGNGHEHIGFYIDEHTAMSNSTQQCIPVIHSINMPDGREPIAFYTHPKLSE